MQTMVIVDATEEAVLWSQTDAQATVHGPVPGRHSLFVNHVKDEIQLPVDLGNGIVLRPSIWSGQVRVEFEVQEGNPLSTSSVVLGWLMRHVERVDEETLLRETIKMGDLSLLRVLCDAAYRKSPHPRFEQIVHACEVPDKVEPFFRRVARSPLALALTQENALEVFKRWNYLCNELRYL